MDVADAAAAVEQAAAAKAGGPKAKPRAKPKAAAKPRAPRKKPAAVDAADGPAVEAEVKPKPKPRRKPAAKKPDDSAEEAQKVDKAWKELGKPGPGPAKSARAARRARRGAGAGITVRATARYVRTSPRKARLLTDHIKGKSVDEARAILAYSPRSVAEDWRKLLESAVANAENNHDLVGEDLKIHKIYADEGPTIKRFRPRAMGRATRIRKRTSHLTIQLTPKD